MDQRLVIAKGSVDPFYLVFSTDSIQGATKASFKICQTLNGTLILDKTGVTIESNRLRVSLSQPEADSLPVGTWIGEAAVLVDNLWRHTTPFFVEVVATQATHY